MSKKSILIINNEKYKEEQGWSNKVEQSLKNIEDVSCTISHYSSIDDKFIENLKPQFIILTGRIGHHWDENEMEEKYLPCLNTINNFNIPTLGICAGLQLIALMDGGSVGKMIEEEDVLEEGYVKHFIKQDHQLLNGLNHQFICKQFHRDEVKELPDSMTLLATSDMCKVQAIAHKKLPIFGVQFHPEWYSNEYPDGRIILENFLNIKR